MGVQAGRGQGSTGHSRGARRATGEEWKASALGRGSKNKSLSGKVPKAARGLPSLRTESFVSGWPAGQVAWQRDKTNHSRSSARPWPGARVHGKALDSVGLGEGGTWRPEACVTSAGHRPPRSASAQTCSGGKADDEETVHVSSPAQGKYWKSPGVQLLVW